MVRSKYLEKEFSESDFDVLSEYKVSEFLVEIGFGFLDGGKGCSIVHKGRTVGQLDAIFICDDDYIILVEVTDQEEKCFAKAEDFFLKWSKKEYLEAVLEKYPQIPKTLRVKRLFVDLKYDDIYWKKSKEIDDKGVLENDDNYILNKGSLDELMYYKKILGEFARFNLLKAMKMKKIKEKNSTEPALKIRNRYGHVFYVASLSPEFLLKNAYVHRRSAFEDEIGGYQRFLEESKIKDIWKYVENSNHHHLFPNAIILKSDVALSRYTLKLKESENIQENDPVVPVKIRVPESYLSFKIIDGQHRVCGFAKLKVEQREGNRLPVVIFDNLSDEDEMQMFIDINSTQKTVDPNLVCVLLIGMSISRKNRLFAKKIASKIILYLNMNNDSVLKNQIYTHKTVGIKRTRETPTIIGLVTALKSDPQFRKLINDNGEEDNKIIEFSKGLSSDLATLKYICEKDFEDRKSVV